MLQNYTLTQALITLFLILITTFIYNNIIRPYKNYQFYKKILTENYKTQVNPFTILGMSNINKKRQDLAKYNDSNYAAKTELTKYQVRLMKVGRQILIDLIDPQLIKEYFQKTKEWYYIKNLNTPQMSALKGSAGIGLFLSENDEWKKRKRILSNMFNFDFINSKIQTISQLCEDNYNQMFNSAQNKENQILQAKMSDNFQMIFGNVVLKCFFGNVKIDKLEHEVYHKVSKMFELNTQRSRTPYAFILGSLFPKLSLRAIDKEVDKCNKELRSIFQQAIQKVKLSVDQQKQSDQQQSKWLKQHGLIWWIMKKGLYCDSQTVNSEKYNKNQLINEVLTFFFAGTETTSTNTTMLTFLLAKNPHIFLKLKQQIKTVLGQKPLTQITKEKIKQFHYLQNAIKQTLRVTSTASNLAIRIVEKEHFLGKIPLKKGVQVSVKMITNHFKSQFYQNPLQFNPDRWDKIDSKKAQICSFLPFSFGQRVCIGQHLAILQAKIAMIGLLRRVKEIKLEKDDFKILQVTTYGPERIKVYLTKE